MLSWNVFTVKQQQGTLTQQLHYAAANSNPTMSSLSYTQQGKWYILAGELENV